eukprot:gene14785-16424_t
MKQLFDSLLFSFIATLILAQTRISFQCTRQLQSYTVPVNVTKLSATVCGASGGGSSPGSGQCLSLSQIPVTPGQVLYIAVGCAGEKTGGYNGGGAGSGSGFGGGGASDIRTLPSSLTSRIVVAAGGGGTGDIGAGGSGNTTSGYHLGYGSLAQLQGGGAGGKYFGYPDGYSGYFGVGGAASTNGGGGGGGWFGGGGATFNGGGGGGSTYYSVGTRTTTSSRYGDGSVVITPFTQYTISLTDKSISTNLYFPSDVTSIKVVMAGAQGGSTATGNGGKGAYISATITGSTFPSTGVLVTVGETGGRKDGGMPTFSAFCGFGGEGGGYSSLGYYISNYYTTVLVAGGGGGAGFDPYCGMACNSSSINGGSGGPTGSNGQGSPLRNASYGGKGGTITTGGIGGFYYSTYSSGSQGSGYQGGSPASNTCGGGGGAGYFGGGGGSFTGGGGGSSYYYTSAVSSLVQAAGVNTGGGYIILTYWSAQDLQASLKPTLRPTMGSSVRCFDDDDITRGTITAAIVLPILFICCCCGCCYCLVEKITSKPIVPSNASAPTIHISVAVPVILTATLVGPTKIDSA